MSTPFDLPKDGLAALIATIAGVPIDLVIWDGDPIPVAGPRAGKLWGLIVLNLTSDTSWGEFEERETGFDVGTNALTTTQVTTGVATITCQSRQFDRQEGFDVLRKIRSGLQKRSTDAALEALSMGFNAVSTVTNLNMIIDHRTISFATLELKLNYALYDDLTNGDGTGDWIETADVTGPVP